MWKSTLAADLDADILAGIAAMSEIDLVVAAGLLPLRVIAVLADVRKRRSLPVLWSVRAPLE